MNWTKFKENHLFSVNVALLLGVILYQVRKDFAYHWPLVFWPLLMAFLPGLKQGQFKFFKLLGFINSTILLSAFYLFFFTPFSFLYRAFFRGHSFKKAKGSFITKASISDFDRPF